MKKEMRFEMSECRVGKRITTKAKGHKGMLGNTFMFFEGILDDAHTRLV